MEEYRLRPGAVTGQAWGLVVERVPLKRRLTKIKSNFSGICDASTTCREKGKGGYSFML